MKALTLWRPWSDCIVRGPKAIENRDWEPPRRLVGGTIAIHGGKTWDRDGAFSILDLWADVPNRVTSAEGVIGVARLVGVIDRSLAPGTGARLVFGMRDEVAAAVKGCEIWWGGSIGWVFDQRRALPAPVPCKGAQGLWNLPADVEAAVREQLR